MFQRLRPKLNRVLWAIAAFGFFDLAQASGQEVILHLRNGDRVSGFITSETTNRVVLTNVWSAGITVQTGDILRREPLVRGPSPVTNAVVTVPAKPALTNVVPPKPAVLLSGELQLGMDLGFSEKNRQLYTGRAKMNVGYHRLRNLFDYSFSYGRTEGIVSANRMDGAVKTDYDLTSRFYVYNLGGAGYDEVRKIKSRYEIGPGVGYHLVKRTNFLFKTEAGVNYQAQYFTDDTRSEMFFYRFAEEGAWKINHRLTFDEKFEFFPEVEDFTGGYRFRFESNLRYALMQNLFFTLTVLDQYDTDPPAGVGPNDLQVRSTLGVKF